MMTTTDYIWATFNGLTRFLPIQTRVASSIFSRELRNPFIPLPLTERGGGWEAGGERFEETDCFH